MFESLKLCFFNSCSVWGGGEKWHYDSATTLDRERFEVVAGVQEGSPLQQRLRQAGVVTKAFNVGNLSLLNPFRLLQLVKWFKNEQLDAIILNLPSDLKVAGVAAKIAGVPRIIYRRGSAIPVRNSFLNRWLFAHVITEVIANSEETKKTILSRNANLIDPKKIRVIYNGIDLDKYPEPGETGQNPSSDNPIVLGTVGRLAYQKNHDFLLDVASKLKDQGCNFKMLIAGDGPLENDLNTKAESLGVTDVVEFCGFIEDVPSFLQQLDVFLLCSHWEGFGYVLTEAMACGKPVVAFNNSSTPEVVVHREMGLLTEQGDVEAFKTAIDSLADSPELRSKMGQMGRQRVVKFFSKERQLAELTGFLLE